MEDIKQQVKFTQPTPNYNRLAANFGVHEVKSSINFLFIISIIILVLAVGGWVGVFIYNKSLVEDITKLEADIQTSSLELSKKQINSNYIYLPRQVASLKKIIDSHIYSSQVFPFLSAITATNVQWTKMSLNTENKELTLDGITESNTTFVEQILSLEQEPNIESLTYTDPVSSDNGVSFNVVLTLADRVLMKTK